MNKKQAFVIYSGQNETGRVFHALTYAKQAHARGDSAQIYFGAEGTYWPGVLANQAHQMHPLFEEVRQADLIAGACRPCAIAFGNVDSSEKACGLVQGPDSSYGQIDVLGLEDAGWRVWLF